MARKLLFHFLTVVDEPCPKTTGHSVSECNVNYAKLQKKKICHELDDLSLIFDTKAFLLRQVELTLESVQPPIQLMNKCEVPLKTKITQQQLNRFLCT
jgi:hypothetical protein